jgi:cytochrome c peroxidase
MFGEHPIEMGLVGHEQEALARLAADPEMRTRFARAFSGTADADGAGAVTYAHVTTAIASFERTLVSGTSPDDRYLRGDASAISDSARRGERLFMSEKLECFHCHNGFNFTDSINHDGRSGNPFHNTGLYNLGPDGAYPKDNPGVYEVTKDPADMGRFKAPTLRNVAVTAPYMHDGSIATLDGVIDHYMAGGRTIPDGPDAGDGSKNPHKSEFVNGFTLSAAERADLLAFLASLTDEEFLTNPDFSDPAADPHLPARPGI